MRLMLVDDDPVFQDVFIKQLTKEGIEVVGFEEPHHAMDEVLSFPDKYNAILLDFKMPQMSGLDWFRSFREKGQKHPVVLVSGAAEMKDTQDFVNLNLTAMLIKPFTRKTLKEVLYQLEIAFQAQNQFPESNGFPLEPNETLIWKKEMVELMTECLDLWEKEYGNMIHLAQTSGIWTVTREKTGLRARTMKRYLTLENLPLRPKWRLVINTADYVLKKTNFSQNSTKLERKKLNFEKKLIQLGLLHPFIHSEVKA